MEDRTVPTALVGLSSTNQLVRFDSDAPTVIQSTTPVVGLLPGDNLVGLDVRPSTGALYGLGSSSRLYIIDPTTGVAVQAGGALATPFTPNLSGAQFGFNFNPAVDKIRVVSNTAQNLRLDPTTGTVAGTDTPLAYNPDSFTANVGGAAPTPSVGAAAYTNDTPVAGSTTPVTTLYDIDTALGLLVTQGQPEGVQQDGFTGTPSPNGGQLYVVGNLPGFTTAAPTGFDIEVGTDRAFATRGLGTTTQLYQVNLATAGTTLLGTLPNANLIAVAVAPPAAAGASTLQLAATTNAFGLNRAPLAVTVTRTGSTAAAVTVNFSTANGTATDGTAAVAGVDYLAATGTVTFAPGQTTQQIFLQVPGGSVTPRPARTFTLTLSAPTGGATLGANVATTVTIPAVTPTATDRVHYFATGVGVGGGPQINVYNALGGAIAYSFFAFEPTFTGGVTVATGDINGDGVDDIVVGTGVGGGPRITVFDGASQGKVILANFFAYESSFRGGVNVAVGDVNGDGFADVIAGAGVGGGPLIRVFDGGSFTPATPNTQPGVVQEYFAYEDTFRGGVFVSAGNFNNDQFDDIVAGTGVGGGPRVRVFSGVPAANGAATPVVLSDFFAYDSGFRGGVTVGSGDINGDGRTDIITGTGPGGGPNVSVYSTNGTQLANFFALDSAFRGGVRVAGVDLSGLGTSTILAAGGPGTPATVNFFDITGKAQGSFQPYSSSFTGGVFIG